MLLGGKSACNSSYEAFGGANGFAGIFRRYRNGGSGFAVCRLLEVIGGGGIAVSPRVSLWNWLLTPLWVFAIRSVRSKMSAWAAWN